MHLVINTNPLNYKHMTSDFQIILTSKYNLFHNSHQHQLTLNIRVNFQIPINFQNPSNFQITLTSKLSNHIQSQQLPNSINFQISLTFKHNLHPHTLTYTIHISSNQVSTIKPLTCKSHQLSTCQACSFTYHINFQITSTNKFQELRNLTNFQIPLTSKTH